MATNDRERERKQSSEDAAPEDRRGAVPQQLGETKKGPVHAPARPGIPPGEEPDRNPRDGRR